MEIVVVVVDVLLSVYADNAVNPVIVILIGGIVVIIEIIVIVF